jgi:ribosomal protein S14
MTDPWIGHKDSCANCGAQRVMIADGLCRACWRETNGDAEMEREDLYGD